MKTSFTRKELLAALEAMEEGVIHFCKNCGAFVSDEHWKSNPDFHIYGDCVKDQPVLLGGK